MRRFAVKITRILLATLVGGALLFFLMQRYLIYVPQKGTEQELLAKAGWNGLMPWRVDGELIGWQTPDGDSTNPILITHGNAGYAVDRDYLVFYLRKAQGAQPGKIYILEYPGYGSRPGTPSQKTLTQAGVAAVEELAKTSRPLLLGESIGTGIACQIAHEAPNKIKGLILLTPFDSLVSVGKHHYPWLPVKWLLTDRLDSQSALVSYPGPVAFLVAEADEITPGKTGLALYENYPGKKRLWLIAGASHNEASSLLSVEEWKTALDFVEGRSQP